MIPECLGCSALSHTIFFFPAVEGKRKKIKKGEGNEEKSLP
jgi:hypothetical protein